MAAFNSAAPIPVPQMLCMLAQWYGLLEHKPSLLPLDAPVRFQRRHVKMSENGLLAEPNAAREASELQFALASSHVPVRARQNAAV